MKKTIVTFTASVTLYENGKQEIFSPSMQYQAGTKNAGKDLMLLICEWWDLMQLDIPPEKTGEEYWIPNLKKMSKLIDQGLENQ